MSRSRKSRLPAPAPSPGQLVKWRKFVRLAARQAQSPLEPMGLSGLANSLSKTPLPVHERTSSGPLFQLLQLARLFESFMADRRQSEAVRLRRLAQACADSIGALGEPVSAAAEDARPAPRFRADIDG